MIEAGFENCLLRSAVSGIIWRNTHFKIALEKANVGEENPEIANLRTLVADAKLEEAKIHLEDILEHDPKIIRTAIREENMTTVSFILDLLETWEGNRIERTMILMAGGQNPDRKIRELITETFRNTGLHVGLLKEFDPRKPDAKEIARAAALTLPLIPKNIADFLQENTDPLVARVLMRRAFEVNGLPNVKLFLNAGQNVKGAKAAMMQNMLAEHQEKEKIRPFVKGIMAIENTFTPQQAETEAEILCENEDFVRACAEGNAAAVKQFLGARNLSNNNEDIVKFLKAGAFQDSGPEQRNQDQILMALMRLEDSSFFMKYIAILENRILNMQAKTKKGIALLQEAIIAEEHAKHVKLLASSVQQNAIQQFTELTTSFAEGVKAAQEAFAVVTPVSLQKVLTGDQAEETANTQKEVDKQVAPEMQEMLRMASDMHLEDDKTLTVKLPNDTVMNIGINNGSLRAMIPAKDGTQFALDRMDMESLEQTIMFHVIPHDINRVIFNGKDQDLAIVNSVFGIDTQDTSLMKKEEIERFTEYQLGQSNIRKKALSVFKDMGVLNENMHLSIKRGRVMSNLLKYLNLHMGLEYVNEQDLHDIAASWKLDGTLEMRTPWEAREILRNNTVA